MADVAREAGVTQATVSYALRSHPSISEATRQRVQDIAKKLGYQPNPLVSALMTSRRARGGRQAERPMIAFLVTWPDPVTKENRRLALRFYKEAKRRAEELGYGLDKFWLMDPEISAKRWNEILLTRSIRGLLIAPAQEGLRLPKLDWSQFSLATIDHGWSEHDIHRACIDRFQGFKTVYDRLQDSGYKRIGLAIPDARLKLRNQFLLGATTAYQYSIPAKDRVPIHHPKMLSAPGLAKWLERHRPEVVVSSSETMELLDSLSRRIPKDLGFVNIDLAATDRACTGLRDNDADVAGAAVDLIVGQIARNERGVPKCPKLVYITCDWIEPRAVTIH